MPVNGVPSGTPGDRRRPSRHQDIADAYSDFHDKLELQQQQRSNHFNEPVVAAAVGVGATHPSLARLHTLHAIQNGLSDENDEERKRKGVNQYVITALAQVTEELNAAQAEFEYRKQLQRELCSPRADPRFLEAQVFDDIDRGVLPPRVSEKLAADLAAMRRVRALQASGDHASRVEQAAIPMVLANKPEKQRWGYFESVPWLMPEYDNAIIRGTKDAVKAAKQEVVKVKLYKPKEQWQQMMVQRKRETYMTHLSEVLAANIDRVNQVWAAKQIQRAWRKVVAKRRPRRAKRGSRWAGVPQAVGSMAQVVEAMQPEGGNLEDDLEAVDEPGVGWKKSAVRSYDKPKTISRRQQSFIAGGRRSLAGGRVSMAGGRISMAGQRISMAGTRMSVSGAPPVSSPRVGVQFAEPVKKNKKRKVAVKKAAANQGMEAGQQLEGHDVLAEMQQVANSDEDEDEDPAAVRSTSQPQLHSIDQVDEDDGGDEGEAEEWEEEEDWDDSAPWAEQDGADWLQNGSDQSGAFDLGTDACDSEADAENGCVEASGVMARPGSPEDQQDLWRHRGDAEAMSDPSFCSEGLEASAKELLDRAYMAAHQEGGEWGDDWDVPMPAKKAQTGPAKPVRRYMEAKHGPEKVALAHTGAVGQEWRGAGDAMVDLARSSSMSGVKGSPGALDPFALMHALTELMSNPQKPAAHVRQHQQRQQQQQQQQGRRQQGRQQQEGRQQQGQRGNLVRGSALDFFYAQPFADVAELGDLADDLAVKALLTDAQQQQLARHRLQQQQAAGAGRQLAAAGSSSTLPYMDPLTARAVQRPLASLQEDVSADDEDEREEEGEEGHEQQREGQGRHPTRRFTHFLKRRVQASRLEAARANWAGRARQVADPNFGAAATPSKSLPLAGSSQASSAAAASSQPYAINPLAILDLLLPVAPTATYNVRIPAAVIAAVRSTRVKSVVVARHRAKMVQRHAWQHQGAHSQEEKQRLGHLLHQIGSSSGSRQRGSSTLQLEQQQHPGKELRTQLHGHHQHSFARSMFQEHVLPIARTKAGPSEKMEKLAVELSTFDFGSGGTELSGGQLDAAHREQMLAGTSGRLSGQVTGAPDGARQVEVGESGQAGLFLTGVEAVPGTSQQYRGQDMGGNGGDGSHLLPATSGEREAGHKHGKGYGETEPRGASPELRPPGWQDLDCGRGQKGTDPAFQHAPGLESSLEDLAGSLKLPRPPSIWESGRALTPRKHRTSYAQQQAAGGAPSAQASPPRQASSPQRERQTSPVPRRHEAAAGPCCTTNSNSAAPLQPHAAHGSTASHVPHGPHAHAAQPSPYLPHNRASTASDAHQLPHIRLPSRASPLPWLTRRSGNHSHEAAAALGLPNPAVSARLCINLPLEHADVQLDAHAGHPLSACQDEGARTLQPPALEPASGHALHSCKPVTPNPRVPVREPGSSAGEEQVKQCSIHVPVLPDPVQSHAPAVPSAESRPSTQLRRCRPSLSTPLLPTSTLRAARSRSNVEDLFKHGRDFGGGSWDGDAAGARKGLHTAGDAGMGERAGMSRLRRGSEASPSVFSIRAEADKLQGRLRRGSVDTGGAGMARCIDLKSLEQQERRMHQVGRQGGDRGALVSQAGRHSPLGLHVQPGVFSSLATSLHMQFLQRPPGPTEHGHAAVAGKLQQQQQHSSADIALLPVLVSPTHRSSKMQSRVSQDAATICWT